ADHRSGDERVLADEGRQQPEHAEPARVAALPAQAFDDQVLEDRLEVLEDDDDEHAESGEQARSASQHGSQPVHVPPPRGVRRRRGPAGLLRRVLAVSPWGLLRRVLAVSPWGPLRRVRGPGRGTLVLSGTLRRGHRPARRAPPRDAIESRRASASGRGRPGSDASVAADAVWSVIVASPAMRSSGPADTSTYCRRP